MGKPFADVLQKDIDDLAKITGKKYANSVDGLIEYYENKELLNKNQIKNTCKG